MKDQKYSAFFIGYDGLGEPGYKYQRWHFVDYLRKCHSDSEILQDAADRIEQLEKLAGIDITPAPAKPYSYYPQQKS